MAAITVLGTGAGTLTLHYYVQRILLRQSVTAPVFTSQHLRKMAIVAFPMGAINLGALLFFFGAIANYRTNAFSYIGSSILYRSTLRSVFEYGCPAISFPKLPQFSTLLGAGELHKAKNVMLATLAKIAILSGLTAIIFLITMPWVYHYLFRVKPLSFYLLLIMAIDYLLLNWTVGFGYFVLSAGRNHFLISTLLPGTISLILLLLLTSSFGIIGIPLATLVAGLSCNYWFSLTKGLSLYSTM